MKSLSLGFNKFNRYENYNQSGRHHALLMGSLHIVL